MKRLLIPLLLLFISAHAQVVIKGTISGYGKNQIIDYYPPIGGFANTNTYLTSFKIKDDSTFNLRLDIHQEIFIKLKIATEPLYLLVRPGDVITLNLKATHNPSDFLSMSGDNAKANYWYNIYMYNPGSIYAPHDSILNLLNTQNPASAFSVLKSFVNGQSKPLDSLNRLNELDKKSLELYRKQISLSHFSVFINELNAMYENSNSVQLKENINTLKRAIYKSSAPFDPDNLKLIFGDNLFLFGNVRDFITQVPKVIATDTVFGVYNQFLFLPPPFCEDLIGKILIIQKSLSANEFDFEKGYTVFKNKFHSSAYLPIIDQYRSIQAMAKAHKYPGVIIDSTTNINALTDIINVHKGHNIYIDIWATWCIPCRQEFPYYPNLNDVFSKYDIELVYISIDDAIMKNNWVNVTQKANLKGVNYLADKLLINNVKSLIFKNGQIVIPRYILINKKGQIVDTDAPRPSQKADLINLLEKKL